MHAMSRGLADVGIMYSLKREDCIASTLLQTRHILCTTHKVWQVSDLPVESIPLIGRKSDTDATITIGISPTDWYNGEPGLNT